MVANRGCPICQANGHDAKGDHLFLMSSGDRWTCRRQEYHPDGEVYYENTDGSTDVRGATGGDEGGGDELMRLLEPATATLPVHVPSGTGLIDIVRTYRGIGPEVFQKYKTRCTVDSSGNLATLVHELKDLKGKRVVDKIRFIDPKDFKTSGKTGGVALQFFGQDIVPKAKRILVTEGELDCMSAYQMLSKWKVGVWSLPLGANKKCFLDNIEALTDAAKGRKELFFSMDQDDAGKKLEKELASLFPSAKFLKLDRKDANSYIDPSSGTPAPEEFVSAFWDAEIFKPPTIVRVDSLIEDVLRKPVIGRPWPWPSLTKATYGRRDGEGMFIGAGVKCGKSEWINQLIAFDCANGWPIAAIKYEEQPAMTVKRIAGKLDGIQYHLPGMAYDEAKLEETARALHPNLFLHQAFGKAGWGTAKEFIRYAVGSGVKTLIIDPITRISNGMTPSETETELRRFSDELSCMAMDMGFFYVVSCHLKAPSSGLSHERGGKVESFQYRGSRAMMESTYYMLGIQRNKDPDISEEERNTSTFVLLEDRAFGNTCKFPVVYNRVTQAYLEPTTSSIF